MESVRLKVNIENYLSQHEVVYRSPSKGWQNGLPLGNGNLTAVTYKEGKDYCLGVNKVDIWDLRFKRKELLAPHRYIMELIKKKKWKELNIHLFNKETKPYVKDPFPSLKPAGTLKIRNILIPNIKYEERLSLHKGCCDCKVGSTNISSFVFADDNLLLIKVNTRHKGLSIELNRSKDRTLGKPKIGYDEKYFWIDYSFPDNFRYVIMARIGGNKYRLKKNENSIFVLSDEKEVEIYLSVATSLEAKEPFQRAQKIIEEGASKGYEELFFYHKKWWNSFWQKSLIEIPDKLLENLWYYCFYLLGSSSRGNVPLNSACHVWDMQDNKPWHSDYHNNDIALIYWPIFTGNHLELSDSFYKLFYNILPIVKKETKETFGIEGAKYPFSCTPTGEELHGGYWRYEIYVTAWIGQLFWWYYLYSQDKKFLKEKCFPVMKEILKFYEGYLCRDKKGKYCIFPCHPVEQAPSDERTTNWEKNVLIDLAMLKYLLKSGIEASKILKEDTEKIRLWEKILDNISSYPNNGDVFLEYEGAPPDFLLHHVALLSPVFPCGEIGLNSPKRDYNLAKNSFDTILYHTIRKDPLPPFPIFTWNDEMNPVWLSCVAARLGLGDKVRAYLYDMVILFHLKDNGFFSIGFNTQNPEERTIDNLSNLKPNTGLATAINEMLLQSYDGKIRVFPALPSDWKDCQFINLRAVGAFLVSSEMKNREVNYILIESLEGTRCNLFNPWLKEKVNIYDYEKKKIIRKGKGKEISFITKKKKAYLLIKEQERLKTIKWSLTKTHHRQEPRVYKGPQYMTKVSKDKMWIISLGRK